MLEAFDMRWLTASTIKGGPVIVWRESVNAMEKGFRASRRSSALLWRRVKFCIAALLVCGMSVGCGRQAKEPVAHLSGEVTLDGKPLPADALASVTFRSYADGAARPVTAEIVQGRYDCQTVPLGEVVAEMHISVPTGRVFRSDRTGQNVSELENLVLAADQVRGISLQVTEDAAVNFELRRDDN